MKLANKERTAIKIPKQFRDSFLFRNLFIKSGKLERATRLLLELTALIKRRSRKHQLGKKTKIAKRLSKLKRKGGSKVSKALKPVLSVKSTIFSKPPKPSKTSKGPKAAKKKRKVPQTRRRLIKKLFEITKKQIAVQNFNQKLLQREHYLQKKGHSPEIKERKKIPNAALTMSMLDKGSFPGILANPRVTIDRALFRLKPAFILRRVMLQENHTTFLSQ